MKNKGFTLAELLGVIVIISIILLLVMIPITKNLQEGTETIHDTQIKLIELGVENWISDNKDSLPQKEGEKVTITVGTLKQEGILDMDIKDPATGECIPNNTEVTITKKNGKYEISVDLDSGTDECPEIEGKAPIIYLNGEALMYVEYGSKWVDPGATAKTSNGVPITEIGVEITGSGTSVNTNGFNTYEITYSATDSGITVTAKRTVIIADTTPPVINIPENTVIPSTQTSFNVLEGVTATDIADGDITDKIKVTGSVTPGILGEYVLTYEVTDDSGNTTTVTRKVTVEDKSKPTATATVQGNPFNSDGWAKNNFQVKIKTSDTGGSGAAGFKYCQTTSTTCTPTTNISKVLDNITINTQSGTNYICVIPYDHAGNEGTRQCFGPYKLDKTSPTTSLTAASSQFNSAGWAKANISVSLTTNDTGSSNVKTYTYCTSSTAKCTPSTTETGTSKTLTLSANVTTNYACAYSTDYAGNQGATTCIGPLKLDKNKPTVTLTVNSNQFNANGWSKANVSASLTSGDTGGSNVKSFTYCTATSNNCTPGTTVNATSGSISMSSTSATNYVCAYTTDNAGNNSATSCKGPYKIDKTKPTITFPASTSIKQSAGSYNLKTNVTVSDNLTPAASITLNATGNLNFATPGNYTITYTATDLAGNVATATRTVTIVDDTAPSLSLSTSCSANGENGWCKGDVTVTLSPSDNASGIAERQYKVGNGSWTTLSGNTHTLTSSGSYTVYYRVKDGAGNWSAEKSVVINIDKTLPNAPTVTSDGRTAQVTSNGTSGSSGVCWYQIDNGAWQTNGSFTNLTYGDHTAKTISCSGVTGSSTTFTVQPKVWAVASSATVGAWRCINNSCPYTYWDDDTGIKLNISSTSAWYTTTTQIQTNITGSVYTNTSYVYTGGDGYKRNLCLSNHEDNSTNPANCKSTSSTIKEKNKSWYSYNTYSYNVTLTLDNPSGCYDLMLYSPGGANAHITTIAKDIICTS